MLLRALFKRPAPAPTTPIGATFRLDRIDIDHVRRYQAAVVKEAMRVMAAAPKLLAALIEFVEAAEKNNAGRTSGRLWRTAKARDAIADRGDSVLQAIVSGVATHGVALGVGYALCLGWLAWRLHRESHGHIADELSRELSQPTG